MTTATALISQTDIFPWNDNFVTGITAIDVQHHKLVDLLNKLAGHMAFGSDEETLDGAFNELTDYALHHFRTEEQVWNQYLPDDEMTLAHTQSHHDFVAQVLKARGRDGALNAAQAIEDLVAFLTHWLAFHILEDDTHMARIVLGRKKGESLAAAKENAVLHMKGAAHILIQAVLNMYDALTARTLALMREVSERRRAEGKLRLASNIIESSADAIFITDRQGFITDVNPSFCQDRQCAREALLGQPIAVVETDLFARGSGRKIWDAATVTGHWAGELNRLRPDGSMEFIWLTLSTVTDEAQKTLHYVGMLSSISQLIKRHHALESAANHDPLTGLPNRRLLDDRLKQAMERSKRNNSLLAVCYLDLDRFKPINDTMGHGMGDAVLRVVAQRMVQALRGADTVARIGGDEFVLLLGDLTHATEAEQLIARVLQDVSKPIEVGADQVQVSASIGATMYPEDASAADELLRHADLALYQAKEQGRGCYRRFVAT